MDVSDYRRRYAQELEQAARQPTEFRRQLAAAGPAISRRRTTLAAAAPPGDEDDVAAARAVLADQGRDLQLRIAAVQAIGMEIGAHPDLIDRLIDLLRDASEPPALRKAALAILQQTSFQAALFAPKRPDFLAALRSIVDDRDADLRRRALGILAREKDEYAQRRLIEGLERPSRALVPAAKAIQFLGYDVHAEYFPLLRRIVARPPSQAAKREAVRLLGADPASRQLLADLFRDKDQSREIRTMSALALQSLAPDQFEPEARRIALDEQEDPQLRSTCITALAHFANPAALSQDRELAQRVEQLGKDSRSPQVKQATRSFMAKYRP